MGKKAVVLMPGTQEILIQLGEQIKEARLRRELSAELISERAGVSRATVWAIEKGLSSVSIGHYAAVLHAIQGMDKDLLLVANDEKLINSFLEIGRTSKERAPRKNAKRG